MVTGDEIGVLLVDDHALLLDVLTERLRRESGIVVLGVAGDESGAIERATQCQPQIVLMDLHLGDTPGLSVARRLRELLPAVQVICLTSFVLDRYIEDALAQGVAGYVSKADDLDVLVTAIRTVAAGGYFYSKSVLERMVIPPSNADSAGRPLTRSAALTPREREILPEIAQGFSKKEIAGRHGLSVKTIERHCDNIMGKLGIHDRVQLARFAIREGLAQDLEAPTTEPDPSRVGHTPNSSHRPRGSDETTRRAADDE
jgi:two-component system response regulator NreC